MSAFSAAFPRAEMRSCEARSTSSTIDSRSSRLIRVTPRTARASDARERVRAISRMSSGVASFAKRPAFSNEKSSRRWSKGTLLVTEGGTLREGSNAGTHPGNGAHPLSCVRGPRGPRRHADESRRSRVDRRRGAAGFTRSHLRSRGCCGKSAHGPGDGARARPRRWEVGERGPPRPPRGSTQGETEGKEEKRVKAPQRGQAP